MNMLATGTTGLDASLVTQLIDLVKSVMSLFSEFPLNLLLVASLATAAFAIFRSAKKAAR